MKNKSVILILFCIIINTCYAQKEANIWYFGDSAGVDFSSGSPVALTDGALSALEGCATISDENGNLLFYTQGTTVWNKNHQIMDNGTGLMGHNSSTQSAIIVPRPGSDSLYFVFTVPLMIPTVGEAYYSIIDISANSGFGKVITKNLYLHSPVTEKITAVSHQNGVDYWVVTHERNSNAFCSFLVTSSGVSSTAVVSHVGVSHDLPQANYVGYLKISPLGNYIACALSGTLGLFEILDFDNNTGQVSNPITLFNYVMPYGLEFSPDESKLYIAQYYPHEIFQVNLNAGSPADIINSTIFVATSSYPIGALQIGIDQKIYVTFQQHDYLGVINNPNELDTACNFVHDAIYLNGKNGMSGLPNFIQSYFFAVISYENDCFGDTTFFEINTLDTIQSISWDFGDPFSGSNNTSTSLKPGHVFTSPGLFTVTASALVVTVLQVFTTDITINDAPQVNLGNDTTLCQSDSLELDPGAGFSTYLWQDSSITQTYSVTQSGTYWVDITNSGGCSTSDTINVTLLQTLPIVLGNDSTICSNDTITLDAGYGFDSYLWNTGQTSQTIDVYNQDTYYVSATYDICVSEDSLVLSIQNEATLYAGSDTCICEDDNCTLNGSASNYNQIYWNTLGDGIFDDPFSLNSTYTPGIEDLSNGNVDLIMFAFQINPCQGEIGDTLNLSISYNPEVDAGDDDSICASDSCLLNATADNCSYVIWSSSGDGSFTDSTQLSTYYIPGSNDLTNSNVYLTLTASPLSPCDELISDSLLISIVDVPFQPDIPIGPQVVILDTCITSEYFTNTVINATSYQWYIDPIDAGIISGNDINANVNWNSNFTGIITYIYVKSVNICGESYSDSLVVDIKPVGLNQINNETKIIISPNPSKGLFNISIKGLEEIVDLSVIDANGSTIKQEKIRVTRVGIDYKLDLRNKLSEIYYLRFIMKDKIVIRKVLVNR